MSFLSSTIFLNSVIAGILVSICAGIVGAFVVVQRKASIAGSIAHASYGGLGIALFLNFSPVLGALSFAILIALFIAWMIRRPRQKVDTIVGIVWAVGMAIGIIFVDLTKGYTINLMSFLFGSIVAISKYDLYSLIAVDFIIVVIISFLFKDLLAYSFDPEFCLIMNKKQRLLDYIFLVLTALSIVVMIRLVGLILVIALLTIAPATSEILSSKMKNIIKLSIFFNIIFILLGLFLSYFLNLTAGALIILIAGACYFTVSLIRRFKV